MRENRYFFYPIMVNMVSNIIVFVPYLLIKGRNSGAVSSIVVSILVGMTLLLIFTKSTEKFEGKTLVQVMEKHFPKWINFPLVLYFVSFWYFAGALEIFTYTSITKRYLNPETDFYLILSFYGFTSVAFITINPKKFLRGMESLFVICIPVIFLILIKLVTEKNADIKGAIDVLGNYENLPTYSMVAVGTYIFSGYTNMIVFGGYLNYKLKKRHYILLSLFGTITIFTSFLIPIARLGEFAVDDYVFSWISTADTVAMQYFIIERLVIPFLLIYLMISIVAASMIWHVGYHLLQEQFKIEKKWKKAIVPIVFLVLLYYLRKIIPNESLIFTVTNNWMKVRFASEFLLVFVAFYLAKKEKNA